MNIPHLVSYKDLILGHFYLYCFINDITLTIFFFFGREHNDRGESAGDVNFVLCLGVLDISRELNFLRRQSEARFEFFACDLHFRRATFVETYSISNM